MKITLDDFNYRGYHFEQYSCELPQLKCLEEADNDLMLFYVAEQLDDFIDFNESFYVYEKDL